MRISVLASVLLAFAGLAGAAQAEYPERPVTIIVPAAAGGGGDTTTRILARELKEILGQPITIVNQGQGGGVVGLTAIKNATPDGYTVGLLFPYAGYKATGQADFSAKDFTPIANFNGDSSSLLVGSGSRFNDLKTALEAIKASPGSFKVHCSGGCGSVWDIPVAGMMLDYGIDVAAIKWVPGQGAAPGLIELAAGGVDFQTASLPEASALMSAGRVRPLAVLSPEPVPGFPNVATTTQTIGVAVDGGTWRAIGGPAGLPGDVVAKLDAAVAKATASAAYKDAMAKANFGVKYLNGKQLEELMLRHEKDTARVMDALGYGK
ncbi:tripartite tricarboxylate transporter substrate binding protein [Azospirillum sp. YIM DDC1]|uniref:Tripartite tricarboxylate transporter substrate binding protein n=1 Tax=Azospirillum aestuarii TaxID=2802052 RepID=A0ABS1I173_9PROT|nr:tripartite tricarboxylate transporter substrate binding protein [Azospirillum aestuarii]MBK3773193.1 tripartite tricarboxylate transporter substrate binding protein [Azospirillum brasilense]MBK4720824.1 tripartite tricarboxylate transporter substrate binding protein [Azospirillum aestuarii]TWA85318.1 tripartite-type tricarboxylate transporter receptor subunit TctC [Azospirillum brasilense]